MRFGTRRARRARADSADAAAGGSRIGRLFGRPRAAQSGRRLAQPEEGTTAVDDGAAAYYRDVDGHIHVLL